MSEPAFGLDPAAFREAFPFHLVLDRALHIAGTGPVLARLLPQARPGEALAAHFDLLRPAGPLDHAFLRDNRRTVFLLRARARPALCLRGQMLPLADADHVAFLCSPWITRLEAASELGVGLGDFAPHDPIADFLFLIRSQQASLEDAERLTGLLRQARNQAESASRAKGDFLATVSHEIRTPLNAVMGFSTLLQDTPLTAEQQALVRGVHDAGTTLSALIDSVLDLSRIEAGELELTLAPFDPRALLQGCVQLLQPQAGARGLDLAARISPALPAQLDGDALRLRQVVTNLLGNAVKFTERGGVQLEVDWTGGTAGADGMLAITVADTGIGIAPDALARLFQPFSQADPSITRRYGGTGLGLSISQRLVRRMGGEIRVHSVPGEGSRFSFSVPLARPAPAAPAPAAVAPPPVAGARVLLVEDNPVNAHVASALLQRLGCTVSVATSGGEALAVLAQDAFDLVFMDCHMPGLDGLETTRRLRARSGSTARVPVVALTASAFREDQAACLAAGMDDFLTKPVSPAALQAALARWLPGRAAA